MVDFTQFFNPSAFGSWNQPSQSMAPKPPIAPAMGSMGASPPAGGGMAQPGVMPAPPGGAAGGGNPLASLFGGDATGGGALAALMGKLGPAMSGNPMLAKFGGALMGGQNPMQSMMSNPGDFAKWMAQRQQARPGVQANPVGNPQPPMPPPQPGMLGGLY